MALEHYTVISADGHVSPLMEQHLRPYCPPQYLELFDEETARYHSAEVPMAGNPKLKRDDVNPPEVARFHVKSGQHPGLWDSAVRRRVLDEEGVCAEVIFHGAANQEQLPFVVEGPFAIRNETTPELEAVGCRIYNRWLADFVLEAPERYAGVAQLPFNDIQASIEEVKWAKEAGLKAVNLPSPRSRFPAYTELEYEEFWATCADYEMILATHAGGGDYGQYSGPAAYPLMMFETPWVGRRGIPQLIFSGVFERYPRLTFVLTELYGGWVPEFLRDMDDVYYARPQTGIRASLPEPPSHYWNSNCFAGVSFMSHHEAQLYGEAPGTEVFMWGSDYPHAEGTYPFTRQALQKTFAGIAPEAVRKMLSENVARAFGFDLAKLDEVARKIGPTVDDLSQEPQRVPSSEEYVGLGFRVGTGCFT